MAACGTYLVLWWTLGFLRMSMWHAWKSMFDGHRAIDVQTNVDESAANAVNPICL